jgi:hypothetical protein
MFNELQLTPEIRAIVSHPARFKVLTTGRRWGKDMLTLIWLLHGNLLPGWRYWYVAPYRLQAKEIAWPILKMLVRGYGISGRAISESELSVALPNGAKIQLKGADNPDSLLGVGVARVGCTEYSRWKSGIWEQILRPMLTQSKGSALFNSSPQGRDKHYDLHMKGQDPDEPDWASWIYKTKDSPFVDPKEVEDARRDMDPIMYAQEYEASFDTGGDRCAWNFKHDLHVTDHGGRLPDPSNSWIGLDFNVQPMVAEIGGYMEVNKRQIIHYFDEIVIPSDANTDMMCRILKERYPLIRLVYPDPTGKAGSTQSIRSDHRILHDHGFTIRAHAPGSPKQNERLSSWNRMLLDGEGNVNMTFSPRCKRLIADQDKAERYPDGSINKKKYDPHGLDAAGYAVEYQHPIQYRNVTVRRSA